MDKKMFVVIVVVLAVLVGLPLAAKLFRQGGGDSSGQTQTVDSVTPTATLMKPANGATGVSPALAELVVTFDREMGGGFSWTGGGENFPETTGKPYWDGDRKTCHLPVKLKPGWSYRLGLNSPSHKNFKSVQGVPLTPVVWTFSTAGI